MFRLLSITLIACLAAGLFLQHASKRVVESELSAMHQERDALELQMAHIRGALTGLDLASHARHHLMWNALLDSRNRISALRRTVETKNHYIASLEEGQILLATAYNNEVGQTDDTPNITANNNLVRPGIIAVSRDLFAKGWVFGREVYVQGHGVFTIDDLLAKRKRNQIDIFMFSRREAVEFGRQNVRVYLLGNGGGPYEEASR